MLKQLCQAPNGPEDGGLMVLQGSTALYNEFFDAHEHDKVRFALALKAKVNIEIGL